MQNHAVSLKEEELKKEMEKSNIPGVAISFGSFESTEKPISTITLGVITENSKIVVSAETSFCAASLSKPVFAYLVLQLEQEGLFDLKQSLDTILPFEDFCIDIRKKYHFIWEKTATEEELVKLMTAEMVLSHTTGIDLFKNKIDLAFEPGTGYRYSGLPIIYLQRVLEKQTGMTLEELAKKYVFEPIQMYHSSFYPEYELHEFSDSIRVPENIYLKTTKKGLEYEVLDAVGLPWQGLIPWNQLPKDFPRQSSDIISLKDKYLPVIFHHISKEDYTPAIAPNSLRTTSEDYARFMLAWIKNPSLQKAFEPIIYMMKDSTINDEWAKKLNVPVEDLQYLASGLGWELQLSGQGEVARAYKTGDMDRWRGIAAIDFENKTFIVFFANSPNGHMLADQIISPNIKLEQAFNNFFIKFGFQRQIKKDFELALISDTDTQRQLGKIYLIANKDELQYEFKDADGILHRVVRPWQRLPASFPNDPVAIVKSKDKLIPTLLLEQAQFAKIEAYLESRSEVAKLRRETSKDPKEKKGKNTVSLNSQSIFSSNQKSFKHLKLKDIHLTDEEMAKSVFAKGRLS